MIVALTVALPIALGVKRLPTNTHFIIYVIVAIAVIIEIAGFLLYNHHVYTRVLNDLSDTLGEYRAGRFERKVIDRAVTGELCAIIKQVNELGDIFEELEASRKNFVSNASHELRSPLTSIQGFLQALADGTVKSEEDRQKYLNIVNVETKRLTALINSMLDLSRLESGKNPVVCKKFEINTVIKQVLERFEPSLLKKQIVAESNLCTEFTYVFADKDKIIQVIVNLIDNAIKYSPINSHITVSTSINDKKIFVAVQDNGYGISKKDQMLVWDRFYMGDKARTPIKGKGTGLGLSIVKRIIDEHGEAITVRSEKGKGSVFMFSLTLFDAATHFTEPKLLSKKQYAERRAEDNEIELNKE